MNKTKVVFKKCSNYYQVVVNDWNFGRIIEGKYEWEFTTLAFYIIANEKVLRKITKKLDQLNGGER